MAKAATVRIGLRDDVRQLYEQYNGDQTFLKVHMDADWAHANISNGVNVMTVSLSRSVQDRLYDVFSFKDKDNTPPRANHGLGWKFTLYAYPDDFAVDESGNLTLLRFRPSHYQESSQSNPRGE